MSNKKPKRKKAIRTQKDFLSQVPKGYAPPADMINPVDAPKQVRVIKANFVKSWLLRGWTITSQSAWRNFGITRLADNIYRMRRTQFIIKTIMLHGIDRFGNKTRYAKYKLNKSRSKKAIAKYKKMQKVTK